VDMEKYPYLKRMSDPRAEIAARVERALLLRVQGNCHTAIAGHCSFPSENKAHMCGIVYNPRTGAFLKASRVAELSSTIEGLGTLVAEDLIAQGAHLLMAA